MPHLIIEYSENLASEVAGAALLDKAHAVMLASTLFAPAAIKTRTYVSAEYHVGDATLKRGFLHALVYLMEGREVAQKRGLADALFALFDASLPVNTSVTVDVRELSAAIYRKRA